MSLGCKMQNSIRHGGQDRSNLCSSPYESATEQAPCAKPPVNKTALRARVRQIVSQKKSQNVAKNLVAGLVKTCKAVKKNKGAAVRG